MIEIRNDEIADERGQRDWADRLANLLKDAARELEGREELRCENCV
jgi:predicted N-formylglutamate amidohydrolase